MADHAGTDAMIVGKHVRRTIGTCRQYAEQSQAWKNGEGRTEDQLLQRIWNLADDSVTLIDAIHALVAERDEANFRFAALELEAIRAKAYVDDAIEETGCDEDELISEETDNVWVRIVCARDVLRAALGAGFWGPDHPSYDEMGQ